MEINQLINTFQSLNHASQQAFYHDLSFKDRELFLKVIENTGDITLTKNESQNLNDKLDRVKKMPVLLKNEENVPASQIVKNISSFISDIAYTYLHILTADKLDQLVKGHFNANFMKEKVNAEENYRAEFLTGILNAPNLIDFYLTSESPSLAEEKNILRDALKNDKEFKDQLMSHDLFKSTNPDFEKLIDERK